MALFLKGIITFYSLRVHAFCRTKIINFNKNETESEMENPTQSFKEMNIVLSAYVKMSRKLKVKL